MARFGHAGSLEYAEKGPFPPGRFPLLKSCQMTPNSGFCTLRIADRGVSRHPSADFLKEIGVVVPESRFKPQNHSNFICKGKCCKMPFPAEIPPGPPGGPRPRLVALPCPWIGGEGADLPAHVRKKCGPAARSPHALADFFLTPSTRRRRQEEVGAVPAPSTILSGGSAVLPAHVGKKLQ